ncbi:hypothetical protein Ancab_001606 [Ancistrocladus abbreviatus]
MVAPKTLGKSNAEGVKIVSGRATSKNVATKFKIYSDNEKVAAPGYNIINTTWIRKSGQATKESTEINTNCLKGHAKDVQKSRANCATLVKVNSQRKALSDLSNVQGRFCRNEVHGGSNLARRITSTSSGESIVGRGRENSICGRSGSQTSNKVSTRASSTCSNFQRARVPIRKTDKDAIRPISKNTNPLTRKSFPVLKRDNQGHTVDVKGKTETVDKGKLKQGFPVKPKIGGKMISQVSNVKGRLWKDRFSDGILLMGMMAETKVDACERARRSTKPIVKTTLTASNARTSKSNCTSTLDKSLGAISYGKEKVTRSSVSKRTNPKVSCKEDNQGGCQARHNDSLKQKMLDIPRRKTSDRRRSYTSLLMCRSKLFEGSKKVMKQEEIPSIDDESNPLEVAEYVDDIYQYYWVVEAQSTSLETYLTTQRYITPQMRGILINWLIEVHFKFDLMPETLYLTIALLDRYLSLVTIQKNQMQLVGLTSLLLASKYEDFWHPRVKDLISISAESYTRKEMLEMEKNILKKLKFRLNLPTAYVFMLRFLKASQSSKEVELLAFYLIELCLVEYEALKFRPSLLCASAIYVARCTLQVNPAWTPLLVKHSHCDEPKIRDCAEMILRFHKSAGSGLLNVTHEKYKRSDYNEVATIKPLDSLPA